MILYDSTYIIWIYYDAISWLIPLNKYVLILIHIKYTPTTCNMYNKEFMFILIFKTIDHKI